MILDKKKYKKAEVEALLNTLTSDYEGKIDEFKERVRNLISENESLSLELNAYKKKDSMISLALKSAEEKAGELKKLSEKKYASEILALKNFSIKWRVYFEYLKEKYPMNSTVKTSVNIYEKIKLCVDKNLPANEVVKIINQELEKCDNLQTKEPFNPMSKINEYVKNSGENGFNLEEVLNPGELNLGDLCKELGLTEE